MSLISTRNLVAPLTNKLHMIAIVLVTVGFVALRLSGGTVSMRSRSEARTAKSAPAPMENEDLLSGAPQNADPLARDSARTQRNEKPRGGLADSIKAPWEENSQAAPSKPAAADTGSKKKGGLADIEKALGIK